jgi:hypothetical protein
VTKPEDVLGIKEWVGRVLENDERARNDDRWLVVKVLQEMGFKIFIPYDQLDKMPSFESIRRCRQKIQEDGEYLPTNKKVLDGRAAHQHEMKDINKVWMPEGKQNTLDFFEEVPK